MKPIYELVTAAELKAGDDLVTMHGPGTIFASEPVHSIHRSDLPIVIVNGTRKLRSDEPVFRRIPATEDPRVLRRAAELLAEWLAAHDESSFKEKEVENAIDQARKELESETTS